MTSEWRALPVVDFFVSLQYETDAILETKMNMSDSSNLTSEVLDQTYDNLIRAADLKRVQFVFGMILIPCFSLFGAIGNILTLVVLFQHRMRNTTNFCLAALSVSDLLFLVHCLLFAGINIQIFSDPQKGQYVRTIMFPVFGAYSSLATARITSWLTLLLGIERFIAVYFPIKAKVICSKKSTILAIVSIYIITLLLFLPFAFKYKIVYVPNNNTDKMKPILKLSELGNEYYFFHIYGILMNTLFRFLPIIVLIILNFLILRITRRTWTKRRSISNADKHCNTKSREQTHITVMLLTVSFIFLICLMPGALHNLASHIWVEYCRKGRASKLYECISYVTFFLETVNSSVNFVIYMVMSTKFCRTYKEIFCCRRARSGYHSSLNSHSKDNSHCIFKLGQYRVNSHRSSNMNRDTINSSSDRKISSDSQLSSKIWLEEDSNGKTSQLDLVKFNQKQRKKFEHLICCKKHYKDNNRRLTMTHKFGNDKRINFKKHSFDMDMIESENEL